MKRLGLIIGVVVFAIQLGHTQQIMQMSNYQMNDYLVNPAVAGSKSYFDVKAMNRHQWSGVTDAPRTFTLSLNGPLAADNMGMGGYLYTDNVGPTRRTGMQISYAYHVKIKEDMKISFGLSAGALQFAIDGSKIEMAEEGDPSLYGELRSKTVFDAKFGAYWYGEKYYLGFTLPQLTGSNVNLYNSKDPSMNRLENHYLLMGGYRFKVSDHFVIEPSALLKYVDPSPVKYDASLRVHYNDMLWVGGSYRNNDAWVAMAGFEWRELVSFAYAYDMTTSNLGNYSYGTHEIVVGFRFNQ